LYQLESDGLVEIQPHRGARVKLHTAEQVRDIYDTRIVLEGHGVRKAIEAMTPEWLKRLERLAKAMDSVDRSEPGEAFVKAETAFYRELLGPVNKVIADLSERLREDVGRYWTKPLVGVGREHSHATLIQHIKKGDAEGAAVWISHHLGKVADQVAGRLEARES
jgi:DNA-binding GntR family transcriptional regulator